MNTLDKVRKAPHNKTMGIEIECFLDSEVDGYVSPLYKHHGFFYAGDDGSLSRDRWSQEGVEFVSQPLTKEWMVREIKKLYKKFPGLVANNSCGIHIHVSKKWLANKKAKAIWDFIKSLDRSTYADFFGRTPNDYCGTTGLYGDSRYHVINSTNEHTIEFRMFKSGDEKWALYTVACVEYLMQNAYHLNVDAFYAFVDAEKPRDLSALPTITPSEPESLGSLLRRHRRILPVTF
jgi:hypothetical protein